MPLENAYQSHVVKRLRSDFLGCEVVKNDSAYLQGIPDLTIYFGVYWAMLEVKRATPTQESDFQPNQLWYLDFFNRMSYATCIYPENEEEVFRELQQTFRTSRRPRVSQSKLVPLAQLR